MQRWWRWRFFFDLWGSFKCMIVTLLKFRHSAPALNFSWELTRNVSLAMMLVNSYRRSLDEGKASVHCELEHRVLRSQQQCGHFFPPVPLSPVSSPCQSPPSFVALPFNRTKPALSLIAFVMKAIKRTARTSLCHIWEHPQRCFPMKKAQESKQISTNWRKDTSEPCNNNPVGGPALTNA